MRFTPRTEEELGLLVLAEEGEYEFEVQSFKEGKDFNEKDAFKVKLKIIDSANREHLIFDTIPVESIKMIQFCKSVKIFDKYQMGHIVEDDCPKGSKGRAKIGIYKAKLDEHGNVKYAARNVVNSYLSTTIETFSSPDVMSAADEYFNDKVPFHG